MKITKKQSNDSFKGSRGHLIVFYIKEFIFIKKMMMSVKKRILCKKNAFFVKTVEKRKYKVYLLSGYLNINALID